MDAIVWCGTGVYERVCAKSWCCAIVNVELRQAMLSDVWRCLVAYEPVVEVQKNNKKKSVARRVSIARPKKRKIFIHLLYSCNGLYTTVNGCIQIIANAAIGVR